MEAADGAGEATVSPGRRGRGTWGRRLRPYAYLAPSALFLAFVFAFPLMRVIQVSFHTGATGLEGPSTFANYRVVFEDAVFRTALKNNLLLLLTVPATTLLALLVALILHDGIRGWRVYRTLIFLPYMLAIPVLGATFVYVYTFNGVVNTILGDVGLGSLRQDWLGNRDLTLGSIASIIVYHELGFGVVLFLARLLALPPETFEAARLDGAGWWRMHRFVTLPQMRTTVQAFVILEIITMLTWVFAYVYSTTRGGPNFASYILEIYIYDNAFAFRSPSLAAAVAVILLAMASLFIWLFLRRRHVEEAGAE